MSTTPLVLGGEILRRSGAMGKPISNLSLQKLAYFCHGWHLALYGEPLSSEEFEAWKLGPVLPTLYHAFKPFGSNTIPEGHPLVAWIPRLENDSRASALIDKVLQVYGNFSAPQLVDLSHQVTGPWYGVYHDRNSSDSRIGNDQIRAYFASLSKQ